MLIEFVYNGLVFFFGKRIIRDFGYFFNFSERVLGSFVVDNFFEWWFWF